MTDTIAINTDLLDEFIDFIAGRPTAEEIVAFKASSRIQKRIADLLVKNKEFKLSLEERLEMDMYRKADHYAFKFKAIALRDLGIQQ